jgi:hypothetical protein
MFGYVHTTETPVAKPQEPLSEEGLGATFPQTPLANRELYETACLALAILTIIAYVFSGPYVMPAFFPDENASEPPA